MHTKTTTDQFKNTNQNNRLAQYQDISTKAELLLSNLEGVKNTGNGKWMASCPSHADRSPSLIITQIDDRILLHCFAGCSCLDVLSAVGLQYEDLFPDKVRNPYEKQKPPPRFSKAELFDLLVQESGIVAFGFNDLLVNGSLNDIDKERVQRAYSTILGIMVEVRK
jgi:hypothetical protein